MPHLTRKFGPPCALDRLLPKKMPCQMKMLTALRACYLVGSSRASQTSPRYQVLCNSSDRVELIDRLVGKKLGSRAGS